MSLAHPEYLSPRTWRELVGLLVLLALTVLPVWLAASLSSARRPGWLRCAIAVFVGGIVAQLVLGAMGATLAGAGLAFLAMCVVYALALETSLPSAIGIAVLAFLLQIAVAYGLAYLGLHLHGWPR